MTQLTQPPLPEAWEKLLIQGELQQLNPEQRAKYYLKVCESLGLNHLTRPFDYIVLNGKLTLYARKDCADQLRSLRGISIKIVSREKLEGDVYVVTAQAVAKDGRFDEAIGAINLSGLKGLDLANALMKCETKAKRRVTLSICGLGFLDESEVDVTPARIEQVAAPEYLPGVEPRVTAETFVANLKGVVGGLGETAKLISLYLQDEKTFHHAKALLKAATEAGMKFEGPTHPGVSPVTVVPETGEKAEREIPEAELFPFEK